MTTTNVLARALLLLCVLSWSPIAAVFAQQPLDRVVPAPLIPGGSLARSMPAEALNWAGDPNKSYIQVLAVRNAEDELVGLKIAGHSDPEVCQEASGIAIELAQNLDRKAGDYGAIGRPDSEGYYLSYGLLESPLDRRYRKFYDEALQKLRDLHRRQPDNIRLLSIRADKLRAYQQRVAEAEARARQTGQALVVLHELPENAFFPTRRGQLGNDAYTSLFEKVKATASAEYTAEIRRDEAALTTLQNELPRLSFPEQMHYNFKAYSSDAWATESEETRNQRLEATLDTLMARPEVSRQMTANREAFQAIQRQINDLQDEHLQQVLRRWADQLPPSLGLRNLRELLRDRLHTAEDSAQKRVANLRLMWRDFDLKTQIGDFLNRYLTQKRTFLQFEEGFAAQHPHMLSDAVARGWPVFDVKQQRSLYAKGSDVRRQANLRSNFDFLAPSPDGGAHGLHILTGRVLQLARPDGSSVFVNLLDEAPTTAELPTPAELLAPGGELARWAEEAGGWVHARPDQRKLPPTQALADALAPVPFRELSHELLNEPPDSLVRKAIMPRFGGGWRFLGNETGSVRQYRRGDSLLLLSAPSPFEKHTRRLQAHALWRWQHAPAFGTEASYRFPERQALQPAGGSWAKAQLLEMPASAKPMVLSDAAGQSAEAHFWRLHIRLMREAGQLAGPRREAPADRAQRIQTQLLASMDESFGSNRQEWSRTERDVFSFSRDLLSYVLEHPSREGWQYLPTATWSDGKRFWLPALSAPRRTPIAAHLAQLLVTGSVLHPLSEETDWAGRWQNLLELAQAESLIGAEEPNSPSFRAAAVHGLLALGADLHQRRRSLTGNRAPTGAYEAFARERLQPALRFLLAQSEDLPDELAFIHRNLRSALADLPANALFPG